MSQAHPDPRGQVRRLQWLTLGLLALQLPGIDTGMPLSWAGIVLVVLTGLKLREARRRDEFRLTCLLLLVATGVLAALLPGLGPSLLQGLGTLLALGGLLALELGESVRARELLGRSLRLLAAVLPLVLVLFLLVPRLGPIWEVPLGRTARTGLSDRIEPGAITDLVASDEPAVRIDFAAAPPPAAAERYWRVLTLERFDGRRWEADRPQEISSAARPATAPAPVGRPGDPSRVQVWLAEPSRLPLLPWSGRGLPLDPSLTVLDSGELRNDRPAIERRGYALGATDRPAAWERLSPRPVALAYPRGANPRLENLAAGWAAQGFSPGQRLEVAENWFRQQPFRYTTRPGTLPRQAALDAFLFETHSGFCEHYAAAFTALMRATGVPARVVAGYQGGEWVPQLGGGGYLDVRQSDAHAWSEVWLEGGWRRVDPSAWVSPERINDGVGTTSARRSRQAAAWGWLTRQWRGLDLRWTRWLLAFDRQAQASLLERLLGRRRDAAGILLLAGVALSLAMVLPLLRWSQQRSAGDPLRQELERCLRLLQRVGLEPGPGEDLGRFCARAGQQRPELRSVLQSLAGLYLQLRFAPGLSPRERRTGWATLSSLRRRLQQQLRRCSLPHRRFDSTTVHR